MNLGSSVDSLQEHKLYKTFAEQRELLVVFGLVGVVILMIIPLPMFFMDMLLSLNIAIALMILLVSMYNKEALDFSVFPSLLLAITLFRLSLNVATTRLILSKGEAGEVIQVFGTFVSGNNPVVGVVIFMIIVLIQFMVITKGAGRIAEVAARFTLDAMPGKQMAIDADLNAGMINEQQAKERRSKITREADFYGAMDGASKFVKGDAVAGIIITLINIGAGFIIGMTQLGMSLPEALQTYTSLTIGDGLVSQIPALLISTGTGILVSRAASSDSLGEEITSQLFNNYRVLGVASFIMIMFSFIPGLPKAVFIALAAILGLIAYISFKNETGSSKVADAGEDGEAGEDGATGDEEDKIEDYLLVDPLELEIGYGLIPLVDASQGGDLLDRISQIRRQLATQLGFIIPPVRIRDNMQLPPNDYTIKIRTIEAASGDLMSGSYLAMNPGTVTDTIRGIETIEPAFGLPAIWITESQKDHAEMCGYTVVELPAVLATHITEIIKENAADLLTRQDVQELIDNIKTTHTALIDEVIPSILPLGEIHRVLQNLISEQVSIRDLPLIIETIGDIGRQNKNTDVLSEYTRNALAPQICERLKSADNIMRVMTLDPNLEAMLEGALQEFDGGVKLNLSPTDAGTIMESIANAVTEVRTAGDMPIIVVSPIIRLQIKRLTTGSVPDLTVLSYNEIVSGVELQSITMVTLDNDESEEENLNEPIDEL
jgi:flagellar biosynthesis protein FlhA